MDAIGRLNNKGAALVFIAVGLVVLLALAGLAIDLGYMYVAKAQLQSAADAAALAGAGRLDNMASFTQYSARNAAVSFAGKNTAAGSSVAISSDGSNAASSSNDVTVGHWNGTSYTAGAMPVNAMEVRARRTGAANEVEGKSLGESSGGPISLFFGKTFGFPKMGAAATAIAARVPKAGSYMYIGRHVCDAPMSPPYSLAPVLSNMAWTTYDEGMTATSAQDVKEKFFCPADKIPDAPVCGRALYSTGGTDNTVFQSVETDFYDPIYDEAHKTFKQDVNGNYILDAKGNRIVDTWTIIVPVSTQNDPTAQPTPQPVWGYAKIRIIRACGAGTGNPCNATSGRSYPDPTGSCGNSENDVVIDQIQCVDCPNSYTVLGARPGLVQ